MNLTEAREAIREIDRRIDANRLCRDGERHQRECALFRERGELQLLCANLEARKPAPFKPQPKCPACHGSGFARKAA